MNGEACDYTSVTDMIQQTWPGDDDYSRNIVGRLTADSGAVTELAEALDERSATPEDAWMMFGETVGKLSANDLNSIANWQDGAEVLTGNLQATTSTKTLDDIELLKTVQLKGGFDVLDVDEDAWAVFNPLRETGHLTVEDGRVVISQVGVNALHVADGYLYETWESDPHDTTLYSSPEAALADLIKRNADSPYGQGEGWVRDLAASEVWDVVDFLAEHADD